MGKPHLVFYSEKYIKDVCIIPMKSKLTYEDIEDWGN